MSWEIGTPNTATALAAMSPESVRILWQKEVDVFEQNEDFWGKFEGNAKDSPIRVINDTSVDKGLKFRVTSRAGYYGRGKSGDFFSDGCSVIGGLNLRKIGIIRICRLTKLCDASCVVTGNG
jgi:hypothetical protein